MRHATAAVLAAILGAGCPAVGEDPGWPVDPERDLPEPTVALSELGCDPTRERADFCGGAYDSAELRIADLCESFWEGLDFTEEEWTPLPSGEFDRSGLSPDDPDAYWELRRVWSSGTTVVASGGTLCGDATDAGACADAFAALEPLSGWAAGDGGDFTVLAWTSGDEVGLATNVSELIAFLGAIDAADDAILLMEASTPPAPALGAYYWYDWLGSATLEDGAYREVSGGSWQLVVKATVWGGPIREDRFLLEVSADGVEVLDRAVHAVFCGAVIG